MNDHSKRPRDGYCYKCGGGYWTLGSSTKWVPHSPDCPRLKRAKPQSIRQQDEERRALTTGFDDLAEEYQPPTVYPGRSWWEPEYYDIGGGR